ncbi:hypothetical protein [Streptomyces anulatus]|uniref:hypothetical protein n=1 Tax=Streptomyces anulatus TaxID=1892 RepID=UPI00341B4DA2
MTSQAKRRGTETETWTVQYARDHGRRAEKIARAGELDEGDVWVELPSGLVVIQVKARRRLDLPGALRDAADQAVNFAAARGLLEVPRSYVVSRPYGYGERRMDDWIVSQRFAQLIA